MDYNKTNLTKNAVWNRKIINSYWLVCLIYLVGQLIFLYLHMYYYPHPIDDYIQKHIIKPNILLLPVMIFTELHHKLAKKHQEKLIILSSVLVADTILLTISPRIGGGQMVLILPLLVSMLYFNRKLLLLTCLANSSLFVAFYLLLPYQRQNISIFEFIVENLILFGVAVAGLGVIKRGAELIKNIEILIKSEEKLIIEKTIIDKLSKTDALTGLYNHITFHEYIDSVLEQCNENCHLLHLALIDIDNFKKVNDTYGHRAGDMILKSVSQIISVNITPDDFAARYGGEEFAVVLIGKTTGEALSIVEQIRTAVANTSFSETNSEQVTISIGLDSYIANEGKECLFKKSDAALYTAKRTGKNKTVCTALKQ